MTTTCSCAAYRLSRTTLICLLLTSAPVAAQTTDDDFEAALARTSASAPAASASVPAAGAPRSMNDRLRGRGRPIRAVIPLPPAGTLPPTWRAPVTSHGGLDAAERAASNGQIDPVAFMEAQVGSIPVLPGSRLLRCAIFGLRATYTFGVEGSPAFRQAIDASLAEQGAIRAAGTVERSSVRIPALHRAMAIHAHAERLPATAAKIEEAKRMLRAKGYVPFRMPAGSVVWRRRDAEVGRLTIDIDLEASPMFEASNCARVGITVPSGPLMRATPVFPSSDWADRIVGVAPAS